MIEWPLANIFWPHCSCNLHISKDINFLCQSVAYALSNVLIHYVRISETMYVNYNKHFEYQERLNYFVKTIDILMWVIIMSVNEQMSYMVLKQLQGPIFRFSFSSKIKKSCLLDKISYSDDIEKNICCTLK